MPSHYSPLPDTTHEQSPTDSDLPLASKGLPLQPPAFQIPDPFAPFARSRPSFDSEDSSDDSDELLENEEDKDAFGEKLESSTREEEDPEDAISWKERRRAQTRRRRFILGAILAVPLCLLFSGFLVSNVVSPSTGLHTFKGQGLQLITREHLENGTFYPHSVELNRLAEAGDGVYSQRTETGSILLVDVNKNETRILVDGDKIRDHDGTKLEWYRFSVSADLEYILFDTDWTKQWRHSTCANFWIHNISSSTTRRLRSPSYPPRTSFASFSRRITTSLMFTRTIFTCLRVRLHLKREMSQLVSPGMEPRRRSMEFRIGFTKKKSAFFSRFLSIRLDADIVMLQVFSSDVTTWWSPTANKLAFLSFDEQEVPEYQFPIYNSDWSIGGADTYPSHTIMRYPKAGYPNPKVRLRVFDLEQYLNSAQDRQWTREADVEKATKELVFENPFRDDDVVISEVVWVGENELMVKATNRIATIERVASFEFVNANELKDERILVGKVVREVDFEKLDGGWAEPGSNIVGISSTVTLHSQSTTAPIPSYPPGYLDILPSPSGFNHLAYFSPAIRKIPCS
ncbi:uncharacterized protein JCM6883_006795 [Sporobolomyces salmoneus]|uniref:uncharacterized protein n=1 Tax=Sporobolomyces salmoneus TaxID=183962 RepID=UPI00316E0B29